MTKHALSSRAILATALLALVACAAGQRPAKKRPPGLGPVTGDSSGVVVGSDSLGAIEFLRFSFDPMDSSLRQSRTDTARAAMARWERDRPKRYRLRVLERGACFSINTRETHPPRREVYEIAGDSIVGSTLEVFPDSLRGACWQRWRIEDLFTQLFKDLSDRGVIVEGIEYDPTYSYPRRYRVTGGHHGPTLFVADRFVEVRPKLQPIPHYPSQ